MTDRYDVQKARYELKSRVLDLVAFKHQDNTGWAFEDAHQEYLEDGVAIAARDLVNAINGLTGPEKQFNPIGWDDGPLEADRESYELGEKNDG